MTGNSQKLVKAVEEANLGIHVTSFAVETLTSRSHGCVALLPVPGSDTIRPLVVCRDNERRKPGWGIGKDCCDNKDRKAAESEDGSVLAVLLVDDHWFVGNALPGYVENEGRAREQGVESHGRPVEFTPIEAKITGLRVDNGVTPHEAENTEEAQRLVEHLWVLSGKKLAHDCL